MTPANPTRGEHLTEEADPSTTQRLYCARRERCLDAAADQNWPALDCRRCLVEERISEDQWRDEVRGLAECGLQLVAQTSPRNHTPLAALSRAWRRRRVA
jgi:hypothetical protein